jgi:hypothetical protein
MANSSQYAPMRRHARGSIVAKLTLKLVRRAIVLPGKTKGLGREA